MSESTIPERCVPAWATAGGYLAVRGPQTVSDDPAVLADRDFVRESALRYSYAYDERRLDLLRDLLTADARFSITIGGGGEAVVTGRDEVVAWLDEIMRGQTDQRRHLVSNVLIEELTATTAVVVTYLAVYAVERSAALATTGFYRFELAKEAGIWRIGHVFDGLDRAF